MKTLRIAIGGLIAVGAGLAFTGCTSTQHDCQNQSCTITLNGRGASTEPAGYTVALQDADGETATFTIDAESASCTEGETVEVSGHMATCTEVGDDRLVLDVN